MKYRGKGRVKDLYLLKCLSTLASVRLWITFSFISQQFNANAFQNRKGFSIFVSDTF